MKTRIQRRLILWCTVLLALAGALRMEGAAGRRFNVTTALQLGSGQSAQVFVPDYYVPPADGRILLVFHMHGGASTAEDQVYEPRANAVLFNIHLSALSGGYQSYFSDSTRFPAITNLVMNVLRTNNVVAEPRIEKLILTSFSAGYAGIREVLKAPLNYQRVNALLMADSLHSASDEPTRGTQLQHFLQFAKDARDLKKVFFLTHSSIVTSGYESTTETADYLVSGVGAVWTPSSVTDAIGTQYRLADSGHFEAKGYLGAGAADHGPHFSGMDLMMMRAMQIFGTMPENDAPVIIDQPKKRTVKQGASTSFSVLAAGAQPMFYQWRFNATVIPGATNSALTLTNLLPASTGSYSVVISNAYGTAVSSSASLAVTTRSYPTLFSDEFETNSASNWSVFWGAENNIPDYTLQWAFDHAATLYSAFGQTQAIPPSPNNRSNSTRAVRLTVNNNDTNASLAGVNIYSAHQTFSSNYTVKFDLWMQYPGGSGGGGSVGSTEMAIFGLNHLGTQPNWMATSAASTDGLWFGVTGEGGATRDYCAYQGNLAGTQTELIGSATSGLTESNHTASFYQNLFPSGEYETPGSPGKRWVEVEVSQCNNVINWKMNGALIAQRTNTSSFTSGRIMLGLMDPFPSIASPAADAFVLFDNVRVEDLNSPIDAPIVLSTPQTVSARVGTNISFTVATAGTPPFTYQWFFNSVAVPTATQNVLTRTNLQLADSGVYSIIVSNLAGSIHSEVSTLFVTAPPVFTDATISEGGTLQLVIMGASNSTFTIQVSTNLVHWDTVTNAFRADGIFHFDAGVTTNGVHRFFRSFTSP